MLLSYGHLEFILKGIKLLAIIPGIPIHFNHGKQQFEYQGKKSNLYAALFKAALGTILLFDLVLQTDKKTNILAACLQAFWVVTFYMSSHIELNIATKYKNLAEFYNHCISVEKRLIQGNALQIIKHMQQYVAPF